MANQVMARINETAQWIYGEVRPWGEFFDLSAFRFYDVAGARFFQNLARFRSNYAIVLTIILALTLIHRPLAVIYYVAVAIAWFFSFHDREEPLTTVALLLSLIAWLQLQGLMLGVLGLLQHAHLRGTHDLVAADDVE